MAAFANLKHRNLLVTLTLTAFVAVACVSTDGAQLRGGGRSPIEKPEGDTQLSLTGCLSHCFTFDCLRDCAVQNATKQNAYATNAKASSIDCLARGLVDVGTCAGVFLGEDVDEEGFWVCVVGASSRSLWCNDSAKSTGSANQRLSDEDAFRIILLVAKARYQVLYPPETDERGLESAMQKAAEPTFAGCVSQLADDRTTCANQFPNDPAGQAVCNKGSEARFLSCVKSLNSPTE